MALNSYENRVYQVDIVDAEPVVAKFYRPFRWSDDAIKEEQEFTLELASEEIPVVAPMVINGLSLHVFCLFRFALYRHCGGRSPELENAEHLEMLGRSLARIHRFGQLRLFQHRSTMSPHSYITDSATYLIEQHFIPDELRESYRTTIDAIFSVVQQRFADVGELNTIRLHGDCHPSNFLYRNQIPLIVDFDDARNGPSVQDLWMFVTGDRTRALAAVLDGYTQFHEFDPRELNLIESLRAMRMIYYTAWLARRWQEPAFVRAFPWFNERRYWDELILSLREQLAELQEPALVWD